MTAEVERPRRVSPPNPTSSTSTRIGSPLSEGNSTNRFTGSSLRLLTKHRHAQCSHDHLLPSILLPTKLPSPASLRYSGLILLSSSGRAVDAVGRLRSCSEQSGLGRRYVIAGSPMPRDRL